MAEREDLQAQERELRFLQLTQTPAWQELYEDTLAHIEEGMRQAGDAIFHGRFMTEKEQAYKAGYWHGAKSVVTSPGKSAEQLKQLLRELNREEQS